MYVCIYIYIYIYIYNVRARRLLLHHATHETGPRYHECSATVAMATAIDFSWNAAIPVATQVI